MSENKTTEFSDAELAHLDAALAGLLEPEGRAFVALLEPHYGRAHAIPVAALIAMQKTGARFAELERGYVVLTRVYAPGGVDADPQAYADTLEMLFVFRWIRRITDLLSLRAVNASGGRA